MNLVVRDLNLRYEYYRIGNYTGFKKSENASADLKLLKKDWKRKQLGDDYSESFNNKALYADLI